MIDLPVFHEVRLPVVLILLFGGLGVAALALLYRRNRQVQLAAEEQFKDFRERAVGLMDQIDALRNRHKTLPSTDPDFTEPMTGATLALYQKVEADLERLWERWLAVMELWNEAERRMKSASTFSARPSEEARAMLSEGRLEDLIHDSGVCKDELDRLNLAHETAAKALKEARREAAAFKGRLERGAFSTAETELFRRELRQVEGDVDDAEREATADPIGSTAAIEKARDALADLGQPALSRRPRRGHEELAPSRTLLDDLVVAAGRLQELASKIRVFDIVSLILKGWVALWVLGLFLAVLPGLMPLILMFMAFVVFGSGVRVFQRMTVPWYWDEKATKKMIRKWRKRGGW